MKTQIIILAAGHGKRMQSELPKPLIEFQGKSFIARMLESVKGSGVCDNPIIVISRNGGERVKKALGEGYIYAIQEEQLGTGHAVMSAETLIKDADAVMVLYADHPLMSPETIRNLVSTHLHDNATLTMATAIVPDFLSWRAGLKLFGRIIRDKNNHIVRNVEYKDATEAEQDIKEVNPAYMCFNANWMWEHLRKLKNNNAQGEYYLTDLVGMVFNEQQEIASILIDPKEALGVNTKEQLELMQSL